MTKRTVVLAFRLEAEHAHTLRQLARDNQATIGQFIRDVVGDMVAEFSEASSLAVNTTTRPAKQS